MRNIYLDLKPHQTKDFEKYWSNRSYGKDWYFKQDNWLDGYWKSQEHPHREILWKAIERKNPYLILEVGCNCGVNLYNLAKRRPHIECFGIDINKEAIRYGRERIKSEGVMNVSLFYSKIPNIKLFEVLIFDTLFTDACLIYIGDDKIWETMQQFTKYAKRLVFLERHIPNGGEKGRYIDGLWYRDYEFWIRKFWPDAKINIIPITDDIWCEWSNGGYILEAMK